MPDTKRLLLTGAGGFVGAHTLAHILHNTDWEIVATDSFRHKGKTDRIAEMVEAHPDWRERIRVYVHDLAAPFSGQAIGGFGKIDYVIGMASESSVDRSIADPVPFVQNNVAVALNTLEYARIAKPDAVIMISTDEVYGPSDIRGAHPEWDTILPSNPYAASKAAQEAIAISYWRTYAVPVIITNTMNIIGEMQDREKFLPRLISNISHGQPVTIHGDPETGITGTRHYLHARNAADALLYILTQTKPAYYCAGFTAPDRYNIVGSEQISNMELAHRVAAIMNRPLRTQIVNFHAARPGHDPHYGLDGAKLAILGWKPPVNFGESLRHTIEWTLAHKEWLA